MDLFEDIIKVRESVTPGRHQQFTLSPVRGSGTDEVCKLSLDMAFFAKGEVILENFMFFKKIV